MIKLGTTVQHKLHDDLNGDVVQLNRRSNTATVKFWNYQVLINYIKGETDAKGYTPKSNRTILIDDNDNRIVCDDFTKLRINEAN